MQLKAYYNDNDPKVCEWVKNLIAAGEIMDGDVDCRSISDINPNEIKHYTRLHFFCGIGGWDRAARIAGWPSEIPFLSASLPCQPFSVAGKRAGTADARHLFPVFLRLVEALDPPYIFGEQVASADVLGKAGGENEDRTEPVWFDGIRTALEAARYTVGGIDIPSAGVGAPNIRQRLYWCAIRADRMAVSERDGRPRGIAGESRGGVEAQGAGASTQSGRCGNARRVDHVVGNGRGKIGYDDAGNGGILTNAAINARGLADPGYRERGRQAVARSSGQDEAERQQEANDDQRRSGARRLANSEQPGLERHAGNGDRGGEPGRIDQDAPRPASAGGELGRMADEHGGGQRAHGSAPGSGGHVEQREQAGRMGEPDSTGSHAGRPATAPAGHGDAVEPAGGGSERMDNAEKGRRQQLAHVEGSDGQGSQPEGPIQSTGDRGASFWSDYELVWCRDEKYRRVGRTVQPLVARVPRELGRGQPELRRLAARARANRTTMLRGAGNAINPVLAAEFIRAVMEII